MRVAVSDWLERAHNFATKEAQVHPINSAEFAYWMGRSSALHDALVKLNCLEKSPTKGPHKAPAAPAIERGTDGPLQSI